MTHAGPRAAAATLNRATAFLGAGLCMADPAAQPCAIEGPWRAKVIGNGLRELDRLLTLLLDQISLLIAPRDFDHAAFARRRNTSDKLLTVQAAMALPHGHHDRLRALARSRACLFHCNGTVRRGDRRHDSRMTAGWPPSDAHESATPVELAIGEQLVITTTDLVRVCRFYDRIAAELLAGLNAHLGLGPCAGLR